MMKGLIFNIQRYSVHDGSGIRTVVFLKGCPLFCPWCSNPESQGAVQHTEWIKNGKTETIGEWKTVEEVVDEVLKDEMFFRTSSGGVTLSGGEALAQYEFARELLKELKLYSIHTAIETTGSTSAYHLKELLPYLDQVLFDLKIMDEKNLKKVLGANLSKVKESFKLAAETEGVELIPRVPLIPDYTANEENLMQIIDFLKKYNINQVHLLPFHQYGSNKYHYLGWEYAMDGIPALSTDEINNIKEIFIAKKIIPIIEGLA
ncbi:pyruvate formate lyase activating enzyme [Alkalibaculum bacchi]|uniref:Pyruvate formate lyase activating enzyme n=1 Tax=Alkalibaculum bacchi TaxID=645887 RepID=A0A366IFT2_9FIRM|nr:glycyl-radical enzyme activating protein [Alkalibaculum bacchi]RBP70017.1 pyruvate formate lyase activating enzyme [Alkalibaculum bacchi]